MPSRAAIYDDDVTAKIIAELEAGRFPWVRPWGTAGATNPGLPRNALTGRTYSGVNVLILWGAVIGNGFPSQSWLTFRQALEAGGSFIPKGEAERASRADEDPRAIPFLKRFTVFNVDQCEGLRPGLAHDPEPLPEREIVPVAEALIKSSKADFRIGGNKAFYVPAHDFIQVPPQPAFHDQINYYRTALRELTHLPGHGSRPARDFFGTFGTKGYAREELAAEMGSAFLCAALGNDGNVGRVAKATHERGPWRFHAHLGDGDDLLAQAVSRMFTVNMSMPTLRVSTLR